MNEDHFNTIDEHRGCDFTAAPARQAQKTDLARAYAPLRATRPSYVAGTATNEARDHNARLLGKRRGWDAAGGSTLQHDIVFAETRYAGESGREPERPAMQSGDDSVTTSSPDVATYLSATPTVWRR